MFLWISDNMVSATQRCNDQEFLRKVLSVTFLVKNGKLPSLKSSTFMSVDVSKAATYEFFQHTCLASSK